MVITTISPDGTSVRADDQGHGPAILILGPGMDDGSAWKKVATRLARRFRVVRLHRRRYRTDLPGAASCSIAQEVDDVLALASVLGEPLLVVGHSSGGVVALEALAASPSTFAGGCLYDPAVTIATQPWDEPLARAQAAIAAGKPGAAMTTFVRDVIKLPPPLAWMSGAYAAVHPHYRALAPGQIGDMAAIHQLGLRQAAYAQIEVPILLLLGARSHGDAAERIGTLTRALPHAEKVVLRRRGHTAHRTAPDEVARIIGTFAGTMLHPPS